MNLQDNLQENRILIPIIASNQHEAIRELLTHLIELNILSDSKKLINSILKQEETLPSAAGRGIAYPHSTSIEINELICVLGLSKNGLDFNSPDGQLCHLILLTLSPKNDPCKHRKFITRFRIMLKNPEVRFALLEANNEKEIIKIVKNWEEEEAKIDDIS